MTHLSPTTLLFCCAVTGVGFVYFIWHSWSFDRFQSLIPTRRRAFKCGMTWMMIVAYGMFAVWSIGMAYIKYSVGFIVPKYGSIPTPFDLWPDNYRAITDPLYYVLIGAWSMILSIHIEETCFWVHLARSIRGKTSSTWFSSVWFKLWVFGSIAGIVTMFMVAVPFSDDPQQIETNIFFTGTVFTLCFTLSSFYVILRFPILIDTVRNQGGSQVVLTRLAYFRRLTKYRVFARMVFIVPFLVISADGLTPHQDVGHHQFLTDLFIMIGIVGLFGSTMISVFMFFPPSDPAISNFAAGDSKGLLSNRAMSTDGIRLYFEPSPANAQNAEMQAVADFGRISKDQIRSIVAPFATPPSSPQRAQHQSNRDEGLERGRSTRLGGMERSRKPSGGRAPHRSTPQAATPFGTTQDGNGFSDQRAAAEYGPTPASSAYAWNLLADHLRIPQDAMGLMSEAIETNGRAWKAARKDVEREMYPTMANGSQSSHRSKRRARSASPEKMEAVHPITYPNHILQSPPKAKNSYAKPSLALTLSPSDDSEDLLSIVSKREKK